ncbi:MAG TPA: lipocalin-like domain-containing protein, partial [Steroidobacteraceae bacterium]
MRWLVLLLCCSVAHAAVADLDILRDTSAGFARAVEPRTFEFPRDHGPHPDFHHEWWYVTGNLDSGTGERFGFELTIFRVGLVPPATNAVGAGAGVGAAARGPGAGADRAGDGVGAGAGVGPAEAVGAGAPVAAPTRSAWRTRELYAAHFAITDVARGPFKFSDQYSRGALGLAGAQAQPLHVWLNDWE